MRLAAALLLLLSCAAAVAQAPPGHHELESLGSLVAREVLSGRPEEALLLTERALALARQDGKPGVLAETLQLHAEALEKCQRREEAEAALSEALDLMRQTGNLLQQARIHQRLGNFAMRADQLAKAALHLETSASLFRAIESPSEEARTWRLLALVYMQLGSQGSAGMARQKAHELAAKSGTPLDSTMTGLLDTISEIPGRQAGANEIAQSLASLLELREAQDLRSHQTEDLRSLITLLRQGLSEGGAIPTGLSRAVMSAVHYRRGDFAAARAQALAVLQEEPEEDLEILLRMLLGFSFEKEGKKPEALQELTRALELIEEAAEGLRIEELLAGYLGSSSQQMLFDHVIELLIREGRTTDAFDATERARARAFLQSLGDRRPGLETGGDVHLAGETEALRRQIMALERTILTAPRDERARIATDLQAARQQYDSLRIRLKASNPERASVAQVETVPLAAVQKELPAGVTLISYFVTEARVHAWLIDRESAEHVVLPVRPRDLQRGLCWADRISHRGRGRSVRLREPECPIGSLGPKALYRKLFAPLVRKIRHEKLILVPHGDLHYLPFAALRDPQTGRYLIENYTLILAPSASVLPLLQNKETPVTGTALVLGAPEELDPDLGPLPGALREARQAATLLGTTPLLGAQATEDRLYGLGGEIDLLHIAAHGVYDPDNPLFSRIALTPGEKHDGFLEVHEILTGLDLSGVNLVVLSACQTARGKRSGGDEMTGLTRAFLGAGSPGVISTLWNIDDAASALLMRNLYRHLLNGVPAAEALRAAQLDLLRGARYRKPYYWAAFTLTGNPQGRW